MGFLKPHVERPGILDPKPGDPHGYVTNDGMWAAVPLAGTNKNPRGYVIIHNGCLVKTFKTYKQSVDFISNQRKTIKKKSRK